MHYTKDECHNFWRNPNEKNDPEKYLLSEQTKKRTEFLISKFEEIDFPKRKSILELGCNAGRNLSALWNAGWKRISGIEINENALVVAQRSHSELRSKELINNDFESGLPEMLEQNYKYDLIFSMAVLQHVHPDSILDVIENVKKLSNKYVITIEYEASKVFPYIENYDYNKLIVDEDWGQISTEELDFFGLPGYVFRLFENINKNF